MNILMTGITGLVGSGFVSNLLSACPEIKVTALVRKTRSADAAARVAKAINEQCEFDGHAEDAASILKRVDAVEGELASLPTEQLKAKGPFRAFFHCAADVNLGKDPQGKTYETNLRGTENAIAAAKALGIPTFHYVSTAYVAGCCTGLIKEDEMPATSFNNSYERSKFDAEKLVRASGLRFNVYRPSIVVGRLSDGAIRKPLAFYRLLEFIGKLKRHRCAKAGLPASAKIEIPLRLEAKFSELIYFVPVDYVQTAIAKLFKRAPQGEGKAYHITGESPVSLKDIELALENSLGVNGITVMEKVVNPTPDEKLVTRMIGDLMPYFSSQMIFDNSNVKAALGPEAVAWRVDRSFLETIATAYYEENFPELIQA